MRNALDSQPAQGVGDSQLHSPAPALRIKENIVEHHRTFERWGLRDQEAHVHERHGPRTELHVNKDHFMYHQGLQHPNGIRITPPRGQGGPLHRRFTE